MGLKLFSLQLMVAGGRLSWSAPQKVESTCGAHHVCCCRDKTLRFWTMRTSGLRVQGLWVGDITVYRGS